MRKAIINFSIVGISSSFGMAILSGFLIYLSKKIINFFRLHEAPYVSGEEVDHGVESIEELKSFESGLITWFEACLYVGYLSAALWILNLAGWVFIISHRRQLVRRS